MSVSLIIAMLGVLVISQPAAAQTPLTQPLLYIESYSPGPNDGVSPWAPFDFTFVIANNSDATARNVVMTFTSEDFIPLNGGVFTLNSISKGDRPGTTLRFRVSDMSSWKYSGNINANVAYTDEAGTPYTTSFVSTSLSHNLPVAAPLRRPPLFRKTSPSSSYLSTAQISTRCSWECL